MDHQVEVVITVIGGAGDAIGHRHRDTGQAAQRHVTALIAVAIEAVVAGGMLGRVLDGVIGLIAVVSRTSNAVINVWGNAGKAGTGGRVAGFGAVAEETIITFPSITGAGPGAIADVVIAAQAAIIAGNAKG